MGFRSGHHQGLAGLHGLGGAPGGGGMQLENFQNLWGFFVRLRLTLS